MAENEKQILRDLVDQVSRLPESEKNLVLGVAMGLDMAKPQPEE
jgi:hypothetical protein